MTRRCESCGAPLPSYSRKCIYCGSVSENRNSHQTDQNKDHEMKRTYIDNSDKKVKTPRSSPSPSAKYNRRERAQNKIPNILKNISSIHHREKKSDEKTGMDENKRPVLNFFLFILDALLIFGILYYCYWEYWVWW